MYCHVASVWLCSPGLGLSPPGPPICKKTIKTAAYLYIGVSMETEDVGRKRIMFPRGYNTNAYAAVAARTSNGLATVALDKRAVNNITKPVMTPNRLAPSKIK